MASEGILRTIVEFVFSGQYGPGLGFLQVFDVMAAILNGLLGLFGIGPVFLGL